MKHFHKSRTMLWFMVLLSSLSTYAQTNVTLPTLCAACPASAGTVTAFNCAGSMPSPASYRPNGTAYTGTATLSYTGGNGGSYTAGSVTSTGITGFTATWAAGTLATGAGSITVTITGSSATGGRATFPITIAGQSCTLYLSSCGAFVAAGVWKEFLCHNLGADITLDPHDMAQTNAWGLNGAYINWGKRGPNITGDSRIDWQTAPNDGLNGFAAAPTPSNLNIENISNWPGTLPPDNSWGTVAGDNIKNPTNDPCPTGYRVPTNAEWLGVIANNTVSRSGTWATGPSTNPIIQFGSALHFGPNASTKFLTLPAAGYRDGGGRIGVPGSYGYYWSSTENSTNFNRALALTLDISSVFVSDIYTRTFGFSIRCIAE